jgi:hypothetical protein
MPGGSPSTLPAPHVSVTVNLDVQVDASGDMVIYGAPAYTPVNPVYCMVGLSAEILYADASNAMFEFQEPASAIGTVVGQLCEEEGREYLKQSGKLAKGFDKVLRGGMDASGALPYSNDPRLDYKAQGVFDDFGDFTLGLYAHHLLGHAGARGVISNDEAIRAAALSNDTNGAYKYTIPDAIDAAAETAWKAAAGDATDFDLARRIVGKILAKKGTNAVTEIVKQVIGKDASRALNEDNTEHKVDEWAALQFYPEDRICVQVTLERPHVTMGSAQQEVSENELQANGSYSTAASDKNAPDSKQFTLIITLV